MTYAELITLRDAIEDAMVSGAGISSIQIGDRSITYNPVRAEQMLARVNRDITAYERRSRGVNPHVSRVKW